MDTNPCVATHEPAGLSALLAGIVNCFTRVSAEQGIASFWRGNLANVVRYFPTQAFNFAFKDTIKNMFPRYSPKTEFWKFFATNMASGQSNFVTPSHLSSGQLCPVQNLQHITM